jgi:hypothetical protein
MLADLTSPGHRFSDAHHPLPCLFVRPHIQQTLDVSGFPLLCRDHSLIPSIATLEPKVFVSFSLKTQFDRILSTIPVQFFSAFNFQQSPAFPDQYKVDDSCLLNYYSKGMADFPFLDMREFDPEIAERIRK